MSDHSAPEGRRSAITKLQQAPVAPLDDDGIRAFIIGTVAFGLAYIVLLLFGARWGVPQWWYTVTGTGVAIGICATGYCAWRRRARTADMQS